MIETMADVFVRELCTRLVPDCESLTPHRQAELGAEACVALLRRLDRVAHIYLGHGDPLLETGKQEPQRSV